MISWSAPVKILTGTDVTAVVTCTTVETGGAYVGLFSYTPVESAAVYDIECKINRRKQS